MSLVWQNEDKEETAQWLASPATCKAILESLLGKVSSLKGQACIIHNMTMYEGTWEKAGRHCVFMFKLLCITVDQLQVVLDMMVELNDACYLASYSETTNNAIFSFATTQVKDKLLEAMLITLCWSLFHMLKLGYWILYSLVIFMRCASSQPGRTGRQHVDSCQRLLQSLLLMQTYRSWPIPRCHNSRFAPWRQQVICSYQMQHGRSGWMIQCGAAWWFLCWHCLFDIWYCNFPWFPKSKH